MQPFAKELDIALRAAAEAAKLLEARTGAESVRKKGRADLVTLVDEKSERLIVQHLHSAFPADAVVAEEFSAAAVTEGRRWVVDPLDGTINYVHGHPFACVSIALVDDQGPAVGVVNAPFLGEIYHAVRNAGTFLNNQRVEVSNTSTLGESLLGTGFPFKPGKGDPRVYMELVADLVVNTHGIRRAGAAALDLAFVACGRLDGYFEIGLAPWDVAAGILLVTEAGGTVTGFRGDNEPSIVTGRVLASNGRVHADLEATTAQYLGRL